jgi:dihydrodipicolinate synthase/N-acetylneuraminate lyase
MQKVRKLQGIIPVLLSPLQKDKSPDQDGVMKLVKFLTNAGVGGFWAMGSASEDINLSIHHRIELLSYVSAANNGKLPIIAGTGLTSIDDNLAYFDKISHLLFDGVHVLPYDSKMGESRLIHFFTTLADKAPFPLWLYHNPKRGNIITKNVIEHIYQHPNIRGIKVGGYNLTEMITALGYQTEHFQVIGAGSSQLFTMLSLGAEAHTTSEASTIPEPFVEIYNIFKQGKRETAKEKQYDIINLSRNFPRTDNGEYAAEEKYILQLRNICHDYVNPLYRRLNDKEKDTLRNILKGFGFTWV